MKKIVILLFISGIAVMACHNKAVPVISARTEFPPAPRSAKSIVENSPEAITAGKVIFETKCNRCHDLKIVDAYTSERWTTILQRMIPKARLSEDQSRQVRSYVMANAKK
jgi:cytochrome c5